MNANELSKTMLEWADKKAELDAIEAEIIKEVLALGKTYTVGNIRASYSGGRATKDYDAVKHLIPQEILAKYTYSVTTYGLSDACKEAGIEAPEKSKSEPSVTVKFI